ncbi:MAG: [protein-PII] uridylyltransferase [Actinomycetes bacterium]
MSTRERRERSDSSDFVLQELFRESVEKFPKFMGALAIGAVGGYGRGELSPGSDLDLLIIHDGSMPSESLLEFVNSVLYPLWDQARAVDHSVRTRAETKVAAEADLKVAMGLLDLRAIAGNFELVTAVAQEAQESWRRNFKRNFAGIVSSVLERESRSGELAYLLEPDLKESRGGLRDITTIRAMALTGSVPIALDRLAAAENLLANVRDSLHQSSGRGRDQLLLSQQDAVAKAMNFADADALMLEVAKSARTVDYVMSLTIHRIENTKAKKLFRKRSDSVIGLGLRVHNEEVVLEPAEISEGDSGFGLRAAAAAVQLGLPLSIDATVYIAENFTALPTPWPRQSREDLVALLGAGESLIKVWEALDQEGIVESWIPEWSHVRFLPQRNALHRHTVDRHMLETAVRASALIRNVHRPDLLLVAAAFHDLGKGFLDLDHSEYGEVLMRPLAHRLGFSDEDCETLALLVREHLLLSTVATRRDLDDPATIAHVVQHVGNAETLELLHALSIADGEATGRTAWSDWKARLVADLVSRSLSAMAGIEPAAQLELTPSQIARSAEGELWIEISAHENNFEIEIISPDQVGLLSMVAGALTISRLNVRSARTRTVGESAVMKWIVVLDPHAELPTAVKLEELLRRAFRGELDLSDRLSERIANYRKFPGIPVAPPIVRASNDLATNATVLEVRMHDRPGILYTVAKAVSRFGVDIRAAIVATLGAEAFDTLYLTDLQGNALSEERAVLLANQVEQLLLTQ